MAPGFAAYKECQEAVEDRESVGGIPGSDRIDMMCADEDLFCEKHRDLASQAAVLRKQQMEKRLAFVQSLWNDADRFDAVVASGRYLKLCNLTEWISECDERAAARLKNEILAAWRERAA